MTPSADSVNTSSSAPPPSPSNSVNPSPFDLTGELVLMTGGTGTIGTAFGEALLQAGARIILWSRGKTVPIKDSVRQLSEKSPAPNRVYGFSVDVSDKKSVEDGLAQIVREIGPPTILINGAGGNRGKSSLVDTDIQLFEEIIRLNLLGGLLIPTQALARLWIKENTPGTIINVASAASYIPLTGVAAYSAAKAGVINLTMGNAKELAPHGIRVNGIAPGFFIGHQNRNLLYSNYDKRELSPRGQQIINHTPYGRFGTPEDLHGAIVFLASRKASGFITGVTLPIDGGYLVDNV